MNTVAFLFSCWKWVLLQFARVVVAEVGRQMDQIVLNHDLEVEQCHVFFGDLVLAASIVLQILSRCYTVDVLMNLRQCEREGGHVSQAFDGAGLLHGRQYRIQGRDAKVGFNALLHTIKIQSEIAFSGSVF